MKYYFPRPLFFSFLLTALIPLNTALGKYSLVQGVPYPLTIQKHIDKYNGCEKEVRYRKDPEEAYRYCVVKAYADEARDASYPLAQRIKDGDETARTEYKALVGKIEKLLPFIKAHWNANPQRETVYRSEYNGLDHRLLRGYMQAREFARAFTKVDADMAANSDPKMILSVANNGRKVAELAVVTEGKKWCPQRNGYWDKIKSTAKEMKRSYLDFTGSFDSTHFDAEKACKAAPKPEEKPEPEEEPAEEIRLRGKVVDWFGHPLPFVHVKFQSTTNTAHEHEFFTPRSGNISLTIKEDTDKPWTATVWLEQHRGKPFFWLSDSRGSDDVLWVRYTFTPEDFKKKDFLLEIDGDPAVMKLNKLSDVRTNVEGWSSMPQLKKEETLTSLGWHYTHIARAFNFSLEDLEVETDTLVVPKPLQVKLFEDQSNDVSYYNQRDGQPMLFLATDDTNFFDKSRKDKGTAFNPWVTYHEFGHYLMDMVYGGIPAKAQGDVNHGGMWNTSTTDSWTEGFASFIAMLMHEKYQKPEHPEVFANFGSMEPNAKPWDKGGAREEFAVVSVLWDLHDGKSDTDKDDVQISTKELWKVIGLSNGDFTSVYENLTDPDIHSTFDIDLGTTKEKIDEIFVAHGFFADETEGNDRYDRGEPVRPANQGNIGRLFRTADGEQWRHIDLGNEGNPVHDQGEKIGPAAYADNVNRKNVPELPGMYVSVPEDGYYEVEVKLDPPFNKQSYTFETYGRNGKAYLELPPRGYEGTISFQHQEASFGGEVTTTQAYQSWDNHEATFASAQERAPKGGSSWWKWLLILVVLGSGGWWAKKRFFSSAQTY